MDADVPAGILVVKQDYEGQVCPTPQAKLLKEQLEVVKYRDADTGALRYSIRPVEGQLTFDKVQPRTCVCHGRLLSAVLFACALSRCSTC